jgi:outer membrane autotransporter protein
VGRLSVLSLALAGSFAPAIAWADCTGNPINGVTGAISFTSGNCTIVNGGVVTGGSTAISISGTTLGTLTNNGIVEGSPWRGINMTGGTLTSLTNAGTILGGIGMEQQGGTIGTFQNTSTGTINGTSGIALSFTNVTSIVNDGLITTSSNDISNSPAFLGAGTIGTLDNNGTIIAAAAVGFRNQSTINTLNNNAGGVISGIGGLYLYSGTINTISNAGTIAGSTYALRLGATLSGGALGSFTNSGIIKGAIQNDSALNLTINGGAGSTFGTLTGYSGGLGSTDIGTITNTGSNFVFGSGNTLLNDNIVATGRTVTNTGTTLQVNNQIAITGNYAQNAGASLLIGVSDSTNAMPTGVIGDAGYGRLIVSGNAVIDAGSSVTLKALNTYAFAAGQRFVVLQAGTATYNEGTLNYSATGFNGSITGANVADAGKADLVLTLAVQGNSSPTNRATTGDANAALGGLFHYTGTNQQLLNVFNPAAALPDSPSANKAGAQLSPSAITSAASQGANAASDAVQNIITAHVKSLQVAQVDRSKGNGSGIATGESSLDPAMWGQYFGGRATQGERDGTSGYHANFQGLLIGGDVQANDNWRTGGLFSYAKTNVGNEGNNTGSSASVDSYGLTAYAGYDGKPWFVNVTAGLGLQKYSTVRAIGFTGFSSVANGSFNGQLMTTSVQAGYPLALANGATLTPLAGLNYSRLHMNGYTETGGSGAALNVNAATTNSLKSDLGLKLDRLFSTSHGDLTPSAQLRWRHEFQNSGLNSGASFAADTTGATAFSTTGAKPVQDTAVLVLGATLARSKNLSLSVNYTLEHGGGYNAQTGDVRLRWQY